jgi:hypothetical protein
MTTIQPQLPPKSHQPPTRSQADRPPTCRQVKRRVHARALAVHQEVLHRALQVRVAHRQKCVRGAPARETLLDRWVQHRGAIWPLLLVCERVGFATVRGSGWLEAALVTASGANQGDAILLAFNVLPYRLASGCPHARARVMTGAGGRVSAVVNGAGVVSLVPCFITASQDQFQNALLRQQTQTQIF